jgi:hypothetical protein
MPTLRDKLKSRRAAYLERIAVFDVNELHEPSDIRVASVRGFLEGGDDIPPECTKDKGVVPQRRRLPSHIDAATREAAAGRLNGPKGAQPSDGADWDYFLSAKGENGMFRLIAQLVRATEYFHKGVKIPKHQVLELWVADLPKLNDTADSVRKAWHILFHCGANPEKLAWWYLHLTKGAGSIKTATHDITGELPKVVRRWLDNFRSPHPITDGQPGPGPEPPPRVWDEKCPCQPKPPNEDKGKSQPMVVTLDEARRAAQKAVAAAHLKADQDIVDEFKAIEMSEELIAQIFVWLAERWGQVPEVVREAIVGGVWRPRYPDTPENRDRRNVDEEIKFIQYRQHWQKVQQQLAQLRNVPQQIRQLGLKNVREVCGEILRALWPDDDNPPYDEKALEKTAIKREDFLSAVDRATGRTGDAPFRLVALLEQPEGYLRVVDKVGPGGEDGTGANGLRRPSFDALSAYYLRNVIVGSTIGHILTQADTADFHLAHHLRFLALFRKGGRHRPMKPDGSPENADYETYISSLIPDWFISFINAALLRVKYWVSDRPLERPNGEEMTYWSENHQLLFASAEYLLPTLFPGETFVYLNQSASWNRDRARVRVREWLDNRMRFGFSEVNSGTYYNQHLPGIFNLVDFSPEEDIRKKALIVLDLMLFDVVRRVCQGSFVAASGRQYWGAKRSGWSISILDTIELLTGAVGDFWGTNESAAISLVTSRYMDEIPEVLLAIAHDTAPRIDRSRTSINMADSEGYGIDPESSSGIIFWWGNGGYFTDETYRASQSWSYRWSLRKTGPFQIFQWIDMAIVRLAMAVWNIMALSIPSLGAVAARQHLLTGVLSYFGNLISGALSGPQSGPSMVERNFRFPISVMNSVMLSPVFMRRIIDIYLAVFDVIVGIAAWGMKKVGLLDENDDRVRVAYPALEQEFRELAITFNSGSLLERQHLVGWRSRDAMLSSMIDNHKGCTSFQGEPCVANLGMSVSVFTGKRPYIGDERSTLEDVGQMLEGYGKGVARYTYDPEASFTSQFGLFDGESSAEWGAFATPAAAGQLFGDDGPAYWYGNLSTPLVHQHENVAISIYSPSDLQDDLGPEETHAHWPFDHFDEIVTRERSGGRWVFGRRDQRYPPRTPCQPGAGRPTKEPPHWPEGKRREEGGAGSGYVGLFSARGMKTLHGTMYAHRELIADGHDNIWITAVGDRATYNSFTEFVDDVLAASVSVDMDDLRCLITMPDPGTAKSGQKGKKFEVSWEDGANVDGAKIQTDGWPRFEWRRSAIPSNRPPAGKYALQVDDVIVTSKADPGKGRVDWDEKSWRIEAVVRAWEEKEEGGKKKWVEKTEKLFVEHDFAEKTDPELSDIEKRTPTRNSSKEGIVTLHPTQVAETATAAALESMTLIPKMAQSPIGKQFRETLKAFRSRR